MTQHSHVTRPAADPQPGDPYPLAREGLDPARVVLVDGPGAGLVVAAAPDAFCVTVPKPHTLDLMPHSGPFPAVCEPFDRYRVGRGEVYFWALGVRIPVRVGWIGAEAWPTAGIDEHLMTALALEQVIPWDMVAATDLDRAEPVESGGGRPSEACRPEVQEMFGHEVRGSCGCGWGTPYLPAPRRSQLARRLRRHIEEMERRRGAEELTVGIVEAGTGACLACEPLLTVPVAPGSASSSAGGGAGRFGHVSSRWAFAHCPGCGWRTAEVPPQAMTKLMAAVDTHQQAKLRHMAALVLADPQFGPLRDLLALANLLPDPPSPAGAGAGDAAARDPEGADRG